MLALLSKRLRLWLLLAVGAPLLAWLLATIGERLEHRHGPTRLTRTLCGAGRWLGRRARGPLAHRGERAH
jgi:hypothetical protein